MGMMKSSIKNQVIPTKAVDFSALKSKASVDFGTVPLYQAKVQPSGGLWCFTRLKRRSARRRQGSDQGPIPHCPIGALLRRRRAGSASWELGGRAGSWYRGRRAGRAGANARGELGDGAGSCRLRKFNQAGRELDLRPQALKFNINLTKLRQDKNLTQI